MFWCFDVCMCHTQQQMSVYIQPKAEQIVFIHFYQRRVQWEFEKDYAVLGVCQVEYYYCDCYWQHERI